MKYIYTLLILVAMSWTWRLATAESGLSLEQHQQIQTELADIIREYVEKKQPEAKDLVFTQLYTEVVRPDEELKVHFRYSFRTPVTGGDSAEQVFEGAVDLVSEDGENWKWADEAVTSPTIRFEKGSVISVKENVDDSAPASEEK